MTVIQRLITIAMVALGTVLTRFLPFWIFPAEKPGRPGKPAPPYVRYLGRFLPAAALGLLVVYGLKDVDLLTGSQGLPELISLAALTGLHLWKRQMLLSIAGGTVCYMLLIRFIF